MTVDEVSIECDVIGDASLIILPASKGISKNGERNLNVSIQTNPFIANPTPADTSQSFLLVPLLENIGADNKVGSLAGHVIYSQGSATDRQVLDADVTPVLKPQPLQGVVGNLDAVFCIIKTGGPPFLVGHPQIIFVPFFIVRPGAHVHVADAVVPAVWYLEGSMFTLPFSPRWFKSGAGDAFEPIVADPGLAHEEVVSFFTDGENGVDSTDGRPVDVSLAPPK